MLNNPADSHAPVFEVQNLNIFAGGRCLVRGLSFAMQAGQRWLVLGANGCGKSSMLNACAGLHTEGRSVSLNRLSMGSLRLMGAAQVRAHANAHALASVRNVCPQRLDWNAALTPVQLADLLGVSLGEPLSEIPKSWLNQALAQRSGGEQQRIALALFAAHNAPILLLDEPLTHLDEVQQMQALQRLSCVSSTTGKTMLMVSHHIRLSLSWATHVLMPSQVGNDGPNGLWLAGTVQDCVNAGSLANAYGIDESLARSLLH